MKLWRRSAIVIIGFVESLIFSGCLFGWPSLLHVLQQEGVYSHLCTEPEENPINSSISIEPGIGDTFTTVASFQEKNYFYEDSESFMINSSDVRGILELGSTQPSASAFTATLIKLSKENDDEGFENSSVKLPRENNDSWKSLHCKAQMVEMTLIYTVAAVSYGLTSILIGFSLDIFGLWFTRIIGCVMTSGGFFCLAFTSKENPWLLWPALNLIALGTSQLRLSSFQFANLWPQHRTTILIAYSSAYSVSTTLFLLIQFAYGAEIPYRTIGLFLAFLSLVTFPLTLVMPRIRVEDHISKKDINKDIEGKNRKFSAISLSLSIAPSDGGGVGNKRVRRASEEETIPRILKVPTASRGQLDEKSHLNPFDEDENPVAKKPSNNADVPLGASLWTLSALLHVFWHFINIFIVLFYTASFLLWVHKMTDDPKTVAHYNEIAGLCALIAPLFIPIAGLITDWQIRKASTLEDEVEKLTLTMQAPAFTKAIASLFVLATMICKVFFTKEAIYISLVLIAISRPFIVGSCASYVRIRFHPTHFNRLNGIFTTIISVVSLIQYPIIVWMKQSDEDFVRAQLLLIGLLILSFTSPGHMMIKPLARKYAQLQLKLRTGLYI